MPEMQRLDISIYLSIHLSNAKVQYHAATSHAQPCIAERHRTASQYTMHLLAAARGGNYSGRVGLWLTPQTGPSCCCL